MPFHKCNISWVVCNSNIAALWEGGGKGGCGVGDQVAGGHDNDNSRDVEFWVVNVFLFLSIFNLLVRRPWRRVE